VTYHTIQGRNGLTDVLRVHDSLSFVEIKEVTKNIPEKAKISDDLQEMKDNDEDAKIIRWALENRPEDFRQWAYLDENGKVQGDLARQFEQAMRLEGIKSNTSKHAAAVIIGIDSLARLCPMIKDKSSDEMLCGMEFKDLEEMGLMKVDILSIRILDKIEGVV